MSFITIVPVFRCLCANRIFTNHCRLKIFVPITVLAFVVLVPVNWTNDTLEGMTLVHSYIDKLSISNIPTGSKRWATDHTLLIFFRHCTYLQRQRPGRKFDIFMFVQVYSSLGHGLCNHILDLLCVAAGVSNYRQHEVAFSCFRETPARSVHCMIF